MILIAILYDNYTPAIEAQLTRDIIALKNAYPRDEFEVQAPTDEPKNLLLAFDVNLVTGGAPSLYVVYKVGEFWPEYPDENENTVILRDLYVSEAYPTLNGEPSVGYYVPTQQGRAIAEQFPLNRPAPRGKGAIDPMVLLLWGGP